MNSLQRGREQVSDSRATLHTGDLVNIILLKIVRIIMYVLHLFYLR